MNDKYTAEQVEGAASNAAGERRKMLFAFAAHLREREAAKASVSEDGDERAERAASLARTLSINWQVSHVRPSCTQLDMLADALEAVAPMLASARVPDGWQPTPANINALPLPIRKYIMMLETEADPAGTIRQNVLVSEENDMLRAALTEALEAATKRGENRS